MTPKYGFVVPFYSNEAFLWETLTSIENQSEENWATIVIDDSGELNSIDEELSRRFDKRFKYSKNPNNLGAVKSWNLGVQILKELQSVEILSIVHADDTLNSRYVESVLLAHSIFPQAAAIYTNARTINSESQKTFSMRDRLKIILNPGRHSYYQTLCGDTGLALLLRANFIFCPTLSFKVDKIEDCLFDDKLKMVSDLDLVTRLLINHEHIIGISESLYNYRRHSKNLTKALSSTLERFDEESDLFEKVYKIALDSGLKKSAFYAKIRFSNRLSLIAEIIQSLKRFDGARIAYLIKLLFRKIHNQA
jgi:glycosyltransferase involved in cell wall biosynthesis